MSTAYRCEACAGPATWRLERRGDATVSWACPDHLHAICIALQRWFELTELVIRPTAPMDLHHPQHHQPKRGTDTP